MSVKVARFTVTTKLMPTGSLGYVSPHGGSIYDAVCKALESSGWHPDEAAYVDVEAEPGRFVVVVSRRG